MLHMLTFKRRSMLQMKALAKGFLLPYESPLECNCAQHVSRSSAGEATNLLNRGSIVYRMGATTSVPLTGERLGVVRAECMAACATMPSVPPTGQLAQLPAVRP